MAIVNIDLSEYDAIRNRNKELEKQVEKLEKELEASKSGFRVIIRKVMDKTDLGRFIGYDSAGYPMYGNEQTREVVVSENYVNFEDVRMKIEEKMKEAVESSIRYHNDSADLYKKKKDSLEEEYSKKELDLKKEYENKKRYLDEKFDNDTKKLKSERDKLFNENNELKIKNSRIKDAVRKLANEAVDILEARFFKPTHAISLLKEILNRINV